MSIENRPDFRLAPMAIACIALSVLSCAAISALKLDHLYLAYAICIFGLAAGFLQWQFLRRAAPGTGAGRQPTLFVQLYGILFLTGLCSIPAILLGRLVGGVNVWTGT